MNILKLKAETTAGDDFIFTVLDIPVLIDNNKVVLMNKPGSPILLYNTISVMSDIEGVGEGTVIEDNGTYTVSFKRGFAAVNNDKEVRKLGDFNTLTINTTKNVQNLCRYKILFKSGDIQFQIKDIVGLSAGKCICKRSYNIFELDTIQQYAGITYEDKRIFLGDTIDGNEVSMFKGRICLIIDNKHIDITDGQEVV